MTPTRRRGRRAPAARRRRLTWPGAALGVATLAVSVAGWLVLVTRGPDGDLDLPLALGFGAFAGAALLASSWAWATGPGGTTARYAAVSRLRRTDPVPRRGAALCWPPPGLWALPLLQVPVLATFLPVAYHEAPGDDSVIGVLFAYALLVAYGALFGAVLVWTMVLVPLFVLGRSAGFLVRRRPLPDGDRMMLVLALLLLPILLFATGIVLGAEDGTNDLAALFGAGDQSSPWLWVARASVAVLVATVTAAAWYYGRVARARSAVPTTTD